MPHLWFSAALQLCPWPGCGRRIELIDFKLELYGDAGLYARVLSRWWNPGYGLVARCPSCRQFVLFGIDLKKAVADPEALGLEVLPDDWHLTAFLQ